MKLKSIATVASLFAATSILPLSAASHTQNSCTGGEPTPARDFAKEGADLLHAIQVDADSVRNHSGTLVGFEDSPNLTWNAHASQLSDVREEVNDIGKNLCRLEAIRHTLPEWQRDAIARVEPSVREMADYTTEAMNFLNEYQGRFFSPEYTRYPKYLYAKADQLSTSLANFEKYAKISTEEMRLEQTLGVKKSD